MAPQSPPSPQERLVADVDILSSRLEISTLNGLHRLAEFGAESGEWSVAAALTRDLAERSALAAEGLIKRATLSPGSEDLPVENGPTEGQGDPSPDQTDPTLGS